MFAHHSSRARPVAFNTSYEVPGTKRFERRAEYAVVRTQCSTLAQQRRNSQQLGSVTGETHEHENHISLVGVPAPLAYASRACAVLLLTLSASRTLQVEIERCCRAR